MIGAAIEAALGERRGRPSKEKRDNCPTFSRNRDEAAQKAGFDSGKTFERAKKVVASGAPELVAAMDEAALGERRGRPAAENVQNIAQLTGQKTRDVAAEKAGFGNRETYSQAKKVVTDGAPEVAALPKESQTNRATRTRIAWRVYF